MYWLISATYTFNFIIFLLYDNFYYKIILRIIIFESVYHNLFSIVLLILYIFYLSYDKLNEYLINIII